MISPLAENDGVITTKTRFKFTARVMIPMAVGIGMPGCERLKYRATKGRKIGDLRWLGAERKEMKRRGGRVAENPVSLWICRPCRCLDIRRNLTPLKMIKSQTRR